MDLVSLGTYSNAVEANLVVAKLATFGIDAFAEGDVAASSLPTIEAIDGVKVMVRETDRAEALEALERMLPPGGQPG